MKFLVDNALSLFVAGGHRLWNIPGVMEKEQALCYFIQKRIGPPAR